MLKVLSVLLLNAAAYVRAIKRMREVKLLTGAI